MVIKLTQKELKYVLKVNPDAYDQIIVSRECVREYQKEYNQRPEVKERRKTYRKRWYVKNKEKLKQYYRERYIKKKLEDSS